MHLLLGHPGDSCCAGVLARLAARGLPARIVASPLAPPARLAWRLDDDGLTSRLELGRRADAEIAGVLVRGTGWLDPAGWDARGSRLHAGGDARRDPRLARGPALPGHQPPLGGTLVPRPRLAPRLAPAPAPLRPAGPRAARHQRSRRGPRLRPPPRGRRRRGRGLHAPDRREPAISSPTDAAWQGLADTAGAVAGLPERAARRRRRPACIVGGDDLLGRRPAARSPRARAPPVPARRRRPASTSSRSSSPRSAAASAS